MSFDKVENAITTDARADADKILAEARGESDELLAQSRGENQKTLDEALHQAEAAAARETARQIGLARHEGRLEVLQAKNRVIDDIFGIVAEKLQSLEAKEYLELIEGWIQSLSPEISGTLKVNPRDAALLDGAFLKRINSGRSPQGTFTSVSADNRISRGFIVEGDTYMVDFTLDRKLNELRESIAGELARELFES
ncbi:V-type ATP synthase subunit E [bacterium]|nr:V-type ATP synthase subunit E [bacterium]